MRALESLASYKEIINNCVSDFNVDINKYKKFTPKDLGIDGDESNSIFIKSIDKLPTAIKINFGKNARDCCVFINNTIYGASTTISLGAIGNVVYLGNKCNLKQVSVTTAEDGDIIIIGNEVTTTAKNMWTTGHYSGRKNKAIIIGDDCMFSFGISLRASDGHPVFSIENMEQINTPHSALVIEPHCWIGQDAAILKNVTIGACSIIATNAVATKSCPRFTLLAGVPATAKDMDGKVWGRNLSDDAKSKAEMWGKKYQPNMVGSEKIEALS